MEYIHYSSGQYLFGRCLNGIFIAFKLLFRAVIYSPLLITGYFIATKILSKEDSGLIWLGLVLVFAFFIYLFLFFLKGMMIALKSRGNFLWLLLFALCVMYTCVAPVWISFDDIEKLMLHLSKEEAPTLTWLFSAAMAGYIYSRYQFLLNIAPAIAAVPYQAGLNLIYFLMRGYANK